MIGKRNISGFSPRMTPHQPLLTGHNINWDHFDILASVKTDYHCKIKETLLIQELKLALNVNVSSKKLILY